MKKKTKALMLVLCAVLLVTASVLGTMAYLTSQDEVVNTFTVGNVAITLDEAKTDANGVADSSAARVKANDYHLLPGDTYTKDPTVHVLANSEDSWIFVKVDNDIANYEAPTTIATQITENGWTALDGVANVYYKAYTKSNAATDLLVFSNFKIADGANATDGWSSISADTTKVTVTAYAVQKDGFTTAKAAWNATFGA